MVETPNHSGAEITCRAGPVRRQCVLLLYIAAILLTFQFSIQLTSFAHFIRVLMALPRQRHLREDGCHWS